MGRGNGQIQIQTRSGTNQYRGSAVWNVQNTVFDANTWFNNSRSPASPRRGETGTTTTSLSAARSRRTRHFSSTCGINCIVESRSEVFATVLTDCARRGHLPLLQWFHQRQCGAALDDRRRCAASRHGKRGWLSEVARWQPAAIPECVRHSGCSIRTTTQERLLRRANQHVDTGSQCGHDELGPESGSNWIKQDSSPLRWPICPTRILSTIRTAAVPDGLNTAVLRWVRRNHGADNLFGAGGDINNQRRQINVKLDHNFNHRHKINGSYSYEIDKSDDAALPTWPTGIFRLRLPVPAGLWRQFHVDIEATRSSTKRGSDYPNWREYGWSAGT